MSPGLKVQYAPSFVAKPCRQQSVTPPRVIVQANNNQSEDSEGSRTADDASIFADNEIDRSNTTTPHPKTSPFRTMLARGVANSGSAAALALKEKLGRGKAELSDEARDEKTPTGGMGTLRFRLGIGSRGGRSSKDAGSRPPVQHSDSIDSDEEERVRGGAASGDASDATSNSPMGGSQGVPPGERGGGSGGADDEHEYAIGSSSDEEENKGDHTPRRRGRRGRPGRAAGATADNPNDTSSEQANEGLLKNHLRRLRRTSRKLRWPNRSSTLERRQDKLSREGGQRGSPAASASSRVPSDSSSAAGSDFDRHQAGIVGSPRSEEALATADKTSLLGGPNKLGNRNRLNGGPARGMMTGKGRAGGGGGETKKSGTSLGSEMNGTRRSGRAGLDEDGPAKVAPSSGSGLGWWLIPRRWRFRGLGEEGAVRGDQSGAGVGVTPVSDGGRPAVGVVENMLYRWFGGVVGGRTWPGVGLAHCPVFDGGKESATEVGLLQYVLLYAALCGTVCLYCTIFLTCQSTRVQLTEVLYLW